MNVDRLRVEPSFDGVGLAKRDHSDSGEIKAQRNPIAQIPRTAQSP